MKVDAKLNNKSCLVLRRIGCVLAVMFFGMSVKMKRLLTLDSHDFVEVFNGILSFISEPFFFEFLVALKHVWQSIDLHTFVCQSVANKFMLLH